MEKKSLQITQKDEDAVKSKYLNEADLQLIPVLLDLK